MSFKNTRLIIFFCCCFSFVNAQQKQFDPTYPYKKSNSLIQDKNFYLLTLFEQVSEVKKIIAADTLLQNIRNNQITKIKNNTKNCPSCLVSDLYLSPVEIDLISSQLKQLNQKYPSFQNLVRNDLRPSGYFQLYQNKSDEELLIQAWKDAAIGMNQLMKAYTENKNLRYPKIDSVSYPAQSSHYQLILKEMLAQVNQKTGTMTLFFQPNLELCKQLLFINNRDEAGRYEPLHLENKKAYQNIVKTHWKDYPYSIILIPGEGPENGMPISPNNKYRCQLGADRYNRKLAPFIIVSGGNVHPFQTAYNEAIEMKKYLMEVCLIPGSAIIIEPHARHTTTNFRNATRIMAREGIPLAKLALCSTSVFQADYIMDDSFKKTNHDYLKYIPFLSLKRLNEFDVEFSPNLESLQMDSLDPLDP
jgi:hypothetical protein